MTWSARHGAPGRTTASSLACRPPSSRFPTSSVRQLRSVSVLAAPGGFHSNAVGSAATDVPTDGSSAHLVSSPARNYNPIVPHFFTMVGQLCDRVSSLAQHLGSVQHPALSLSLAQRQKLQGFRHSFTGVHIGHRAGALAVRPVPLHFPRSVSPRASGHGFQQQHEAGDGLQWALAPNLHLPWSYQSEDAPTSNSIATATASLTPTGASSTPTSPVGEPAPSLLFLLLLGPSGLQAAINARLAALTLILNSVVSLQHRVALTALWHVGQVIQASDRIRRSLPSPRDVPDLLQYGAARAVVHAEESAVLVLARTASAASAAAAGVPAATAAVTGSAVAAAAAAMVAAPHLSLLQHARRRLLAAAEPLLAQLHDLRRGCTTHVLLRFMLFSSLKPALRRDLLMQLDVLARRAAQLALLQEQHDAWTARQPFPPGDTASAQTAAGAGSSTAVASAAAQEPEPSSPSSPAISASDNSASSSASRLSARWFRRVFVPEMLACARQLRCETRGSPPDDRAPGDPPGRFDLRDLYRLIRVIEVAVEDLAQYQ